MRECKKKNVLAWNSALEITWWVEATTATEHGVIHVCQCTDVPKLLYFHTLLCPAPHTQLSVFKLCVICDWNVPKDHNEYCYEHPHKCMHVPSLESEVLAEVWRCYPNHCHKGLGVVIAVNRCVLHSALTQHCHITHKQTKLYSTPTLLTLTTRTFQITCAACESMFTSHAVSVTELHVYICVGNPVLVIT